MKMLLVLFATLATVVGCKSINVEDGRLSPEMLPYAEKYLGSYHEMGGDGTLTLSMSKDNKVYLSVDNGMLANRTCQDDIGNLTQIVSYAPAKISRATFEFNPGQCKNKVMGKSIMIKAREKGDTIILTTRILQSIQYSGHCGPNGCARDEYRSYLTRKFAKSTNQ